MSAIFFKKGEKHNISKHFLTSEFQCKCSYSSCIDQMVKQELLDRLEKIREEVKMPITITSGFRCPEYQQFLRKSGINTIVAKKSTHELGQAADISCKLPIDDLLKICEKYFTSIGTAKNFLHLDLRPGNRRWVY